MLELIALHLVVLNPCLYDFMEPNEELTSSVVKDQLNHFRFKKIVEEEAKNPLK
jgi:hypothetical protein